jgi:integrase
MPAEPSGHVYRVERMRGPQWYAKYRLPDGRQVQRRIGPAWTERGRPPAGWFTKRTAEAWLRELLGEARRGTLPGQVRTGVTFAEAADEWLRYIEHDRERKPSTVAGYRALVRSQLLPTFGDLPLESITTPMIEGWLSGVDRASSTRSKALVLLHGIFQRERKLHGLPVNPAADVEKPSSRRSGDIEVFSPEEVRALVRAASSEQDAAIYLTAAFTGLRRGELLALRWRDVDFAGQVVRVRASFSEGVLTTPKSGKVRSVPIAPEVQSIADSSRLDRPLRSARRTPSGACG